jgi:hypothetical protein
MIHVMDVVNNKWAGHSQITVPRIPLIGKETKVFAMGSCFALEIRSALREQGYTVLPDYFSIPFDPAKARIGKLPARDNILHYDTAAIVHEIERSVSDRPTLFPDMIVMPGKFGERTWVSLNRPEVEAVDCDELVKVNGGIEQAFDEGLAAADVVIITLGLTEAWTVRDSGSPAGVGPRSDGDPRWNVLEFNRLDYRDNRNNMFRTLEALFYHWPQKRVILTVSPIPLKRTWSGKDVVVANTESKAILRAVAAELCERYTDVCYWPSFEIVQNMEPDPFEDDRRHVKPWVVEMIVSGFLKAFGR